MSAFNQQQLKLIEALFDEALETKPEDLDSWLLSKCPSDDALRTHLRKLIIASDALRTADLRGKVAPFDAEELKIESSNIGDRIGPYTLIEPLGKGGFGVVWLAERREPMVQRVALKILKTTQSSPAKLALFEQERQALAMMDHPNIAKILDGGVTPEGQPYFVMEFVNGEPITDFADRRKLTIRQRLQLFVQVCEAFQHAHSRGIIHRDIKPSNILVALTDEHIATDKDSVQGLRVKVIDFGLVKATGQDLHGKSVVIEDGRIVGTPAYMSPEQAAGQISAISTLSDVYSLGVLLYELLAGVLPFDQESLESMARREILKIIREVPAPSPSTKLSSVDEQRAAYIATARQCAKGRLSEDLRRELEWIPLKALRKEPDRRYASAASLAADVRRYLEGAALEAAPDSRGYATRKFIGRHRLQFAAGISIVMLLILAVIGTSYGMTRAREAQRVAEQRADEIDRNAYVANVQMAGEYLQQGDIKRLRERIDASKNSANKNWEWAWLDACSDESLVSMSEHESWVYSATFSADGTRVVTASDDKTARVWDAQSGKELTTLRGHESSVTSAAFSPDGIRVVTAGDKTARVWDAQSGKELTTLRGHEEGLLAATFSPDGTRVLTASFDETARVWDAPSGKELAILRGHEDSVNSATFSPDGTRVLTASFDETARVWDAQSGKELAILRGHEGSVTSATFSPDGTRVLTASFDKTARVWDAQNGKELAILRGHEREVNSATFSTDGTRVVTASWEKTARIWDAQSGKELAILRGHEREVNSATFSPDGTRVVTVSQDKTARIWDAHIRKELAILSGHDDCLFSATFSPDGTRLVTASIDTTARIWDAATVQELAILRGHESSVYSATFSPDGTRVVTASPDKTARVWDAQSGKELTTLRGHEEGLLAATFSPDGTRVVTASWDKTARIWDAHSGKELAILRGHEGSVTSATFSPDGTRVLTASNDKTARTWDATTGKEYALVRTKPLDDSSAMFIANGALVLTAADDNTARVCDAQSGEELAILRSHEEIVNSATFNPNGSRIVTASCDQTARLWDAQRGTELTILRGHEITVSSATFSPDGTRVVTASLDGTARIWHSTPYRERFPAIQAAREAETRARVAINARIAAGETVQAIRDHAIADSSLADVDRTAYLIVTCELLEAQSHAAP